MTPEPREPWVDADLMGGREKQKQVYGVPGGSTIGQQRSHDYLSSTGSQEA